MSTLVVTMEFTVDIPKDAEQFASILAEVIKDKGTTAITDDYSVYDFEGNTKVLDAIVKESGKI